MTRLEIAHPEAAWLRETVPLSDPRVVFTPGDFAMQATFQGPSGVRVLS